MNESRRIWIKSEFLDLVDFGGVAILVQTVIDVDV